MRIRLPEQGTNIPLVLFSPGLGGTTAGGSLWAKAWVARGLAVIHLEHPGSDAAVYRTPGTPDERRARLRAAASAEQLHARVADSGFILDQLAERSSEGACNLSRIDRSRIGFAGHSMGAWTAQGLAGQSYAGRGAPFRDSRIKAAIAFSPSALTVDDPAKAFGQIGIPFLSITGSRDGAVVRPANTPPDLTAEAQRTGPWRGMPPGQKYLLVFQDGDHMVFSGNLRRAPTAIDNHIQATTIAATTAFWGMTLLSSAEDAKAMVALPKLLAPGDRFETK